MQEALWVIVLAAIASNISILMQIAEFGFGHTGLMQTRRRRRGQHVPTRSAVQLAPLRSTMQAPPARRMLPHKESAAWRVSAPTRTW